MALADAILELADEMEKENDGPLLKGYAKALKLMVKASTGNDSESTNPQISAFTQHQQEVEKAKEEFRKKRLEAEEGLNEKTIVCTGGDSDGTSVPIDATMPVGAKVEIGGQVYQLKEGDKLEYLETPIPESILKLG